MSEKDQGEDQQRHHGWRHDDQRLRNKIESLRRIQFGRRGFLRPEVLELFEGGPLNGVDIMNKLQEQSHGWYRPSPGSIYPILEQLQKEGLIAKNDEGKFELTPAFAAEAGMGDDLTSAVSSMESNVSFLEDLLSSDAGRLTKCKSRVERLTKRLETLNTAISRGSAP